MEFPVLSKELRITLRRKESFFTAFFLYTFLAVAISLVWGVMAENRVLVLWRDWAARILFFFTLGFGFLGFCFQAGLMASRILVLEREKKSSSLIRVAPLRPSDLVFQKMATPILIEWLFLFGMLPVLSLVFLLGGIEPKEFAYHLTNLAIWTNTSILLGLRFSAYAKNTNKARGKTIGSLIFLAFILPYSADFFNGLAGVFRLTNLPGEFDILMGTTFEQLAKATAPLEALSPAWMSFSWYLGDLLPIWPFYDDFFFDIRISQVFPRCPALLSWILHTLLQTLLFFGAVKGWNRTTEEAESATGFDRHGGVRGIFRWVKSGRATRGFFGGSWRVFYDLEDRELFKKGRVSKTLLLLLYLFLVIAFLIFLVVMEERSIAEYGIVLFPVTAALSFISAIGFAANSLRRERDRDCATFLLASPIEARSIFFGKWAYYISLAVKGMAIGLIATLCWCYFTWPGRRPEQNFTFLTLCFILPWVPLLTGFSVYFGSRSKKGGSILRFLIPIGLLWGSGFLVIGLVELMDSFQFLDWLGEFLEWFLYTFIPWALLVSCALFALFCGRLFPTGTGRLPLVRAIICGLCVGLLALEIWASSLNQNDSFYYWGNESVRIADARIIGRWWVLPMCLSFLLWVFIATRKRRWWLRVLIGKEQSL